MENYLQREKKQENINLAILKKQRMERRIKIGMRIANEKMSNCTVIKESVTFGGKEMNPALLFSLF